MRGSGYIRNFRDLKFSHRCWLEINVFWDITLCQLVNNYRRFEGTWCLESASSRRVFDL